MVAGFPLIADTQSCGAATLVPAMPPDAGIKVFRRSTPYDCPKDKGAVEIQHNVMRKNQAIRLRQRIVILRNNKNPFHHSV
jgi:hypothetical protein